ncbi:sodium:solute symporter family transporter [Thermoactinomyces daqus]|uniref:sodium:solute symporter family transporter n=1 Tax=Thermoactinomyces daqus TaxID=1329516 RepID=UPI00051A1AB8|nr:hypothetical protein [Thermoactinomyces daqus]
MDSLIVLAVYLGFIAGIPFFLRRENTKEDYLAGNRKFGTWSMALSVASTWIWAPALFVSAEKAYSNGIPGLFWFLVPNVLCLLIFIPIAKRIREQMSNGFTLSEYMEHRYSPQRCICFSCRHCPCSPPWFTAGILLHAANGVSFNVSRGTGWLLDRIGPNMLFYA